MHHKKSFLPYLLILIGIFLPIYLMIQMKQAEKAAEQAGFPPDVITSTGSAKGLNGDVEVEVIANSERIYSVKVRSHKETEGIGTVAISELPSVILDSQSIQPDAISGATETSRAIKEAVKAALKNGGIDIAPFDHAPIFSDSGEGKEEVLQTDIAIIGAGGAGMTAAIEAADAGKKVIVLESLGMTGGNSVRSTGGLNAAKTTLQDKNTFDEAAGVLKTLAVAGEKYSDHKVIQELSKTVRTQWEAYQASPEGYFDSTELFRLDTMIGGKGLNDPELVRTLTENSAPAIDWLKSIGADLTSVSSFGGASVKRIHRPVNSEGKTISVGSYMIPILQENAEKRGVQFLFNTRAEQILTDESGKVTGVQATGPSHSNITVQAKAVIVASGGFGANLDMVTKYRPELKGFMTTNAPSILGDGIIMGEAIGADSVDLEQIQIHPTVEFNSAALITEGLRGDGAILVNAEGKRFVDEVGTRDAVSAAEISQPGGFAYLIVDQAMADASNVIQGYISKKFTVSGKDYAELSAALSIDPVVFEATMREWNSSVLEKSDALFNRTSFASPLDTAPYYAIKVTPGVHHTMGGLRINASANVLRADRSAIPGLFAAGEVTGGIHGANRLGGNAVADFTVFGRIAGQSAAAYVN